MPRKIRKNNLIPNQNRTITTRLMQISIVLDDYVYKNQPITAEQANMFIAEVAMYRPSCLKDPRSLQVIEKLTRCMRKIITEENEDSTGENDNMESRDSCTASNNILENIPQDTYNADTCISPTYSDSNDNEVEPMNENITIDQSKDDNDCIETNNTYINNTHELERTMSSLSLKDNILQEEENDGCYSQSVLLNYKNTDNGVINLDNECGQDIEAYTEEIASIRNANNIKTVNSKIIENTHMNAARVEVKSIKNLNIKQRKISNTRRMNKRKPQVTKSRLIDVVATNVINKHKEILNSTVKIKPLFSPPFAKQNKQIKANFNDNNNNIKSINTSDTSQDTSFTNASVGRNSKAKAKTKSNVVVDGLSWIENIKYVREVTVEEIDPQLNNLSETFWDTFCLPPVWDKRDFEY